MVFKAKLIEDHQYINSKGRFELLGIMFTFLPVGFVLDYYDYSVLSIGVVSLIYVLALLYAKRYASVLQIIGGNRQIEIDRDKIIILSKRRKVDELIQLEDVDSIYLHDTHADPNNFSITELTSAARGVAEGSYLEIDINGSSRRFYFESESSYMLVQIRKLIGQWGKVRRHLKRL